MSKKYLEDTLILKGIYKGKEEFLERLMDKYISYTKKIVCSISGGFLSQQDVEEIISDIFFAIWKNRKQLKFNEDIKPYLAQIARNKTKNKIRQLSSKLEIANPNINDSEEGVLINELIINELITNEQVEQIQEFVNTFPYPEKDILYAYYFYEFKLSNIASKLGLPLSTVKTKLYRSREKLKQVLIDGGLYEKHI